MGWRTLCALTGALLICAFGNGAHGAAIRSVSIPRVPQPPKLEDFAGMTPSGAATQLQRIDNFVQNRPSDGKPPTQRTEAYLGYDNTNLYVVFLCFDSSPQAIRSNVARRENVFDDDLIEVTLDTFHDQRHGFLFNVNPAGVQADGLWTEGSGSDWSWDTLWYSRGKVNDQGYIVWMAIPFRSLRFPTTAGQVWGFTLKRYIARSDETDFWPQVSNNDSGRLTQAATMAGLENITPGRNLQLIPYVSGRAFRALDTRDAAQPFFASRAFEMKPGLDAKFVFHDSLVLDATVNPDFAQVESDEPQLTVNQRFEVFFPEKRPFFLENANFFEAPLISTFRQSRYVFTRRIADPSFGTRLSGKTGPWNLGFMVADDRSPGKVVPDYDPLTGQRAYFAVGRVTRDFGRQATAGAFFTTREFQNDFNRVGGVDTFLRLNKNWTATYRAAVSSTRNAADGYLFGQNHEAVLHGSGVRFYYDMLFQDISPNFRTETGFVPRTDIRAVNQYFHYYWRKEGKRLILWGPEGNTNQLWDHQGNLLQQIVSFDWAMGFRGNIIVAPIIGYQTDTLRPQDFSGLPGNHKYVQDSVGLVFRGAPYRFFSWDTRFFRDGSVVMGPAVGQLPYTADETFVQQVITIRPTGRLQIDNTYILDRLLNGRAHHSAFNNHIIRTKWNYQFTREFALRVTAQYDATLANPLYSSLSTTKNMNYDILFSYLPHPGTAVYVGYNTNLANLDPSLCRHLPGSTQCDPNDTSLLRTRNQFINDGRQFFVKVSYLFRR